MVASVHRNYFLFSNIFSKNFKKIKNKSSLSTRLNVAKGLLCDIISFQNNKFPLRDQSNFREHMSSVKYKEA